MNSHQEEQIKVINAIEKKIQNDNLRSTVVPIIKDYVNDKKIALTSIHVLKKTFAKQIEKNIINPLKEIEKNHHYYPCSNLHITIKNLRGIHYPPIFNKQEVLNAKEIYSKIIPLHFKFKVYFYKLLIFPTSISLMGTSDQELDKIIFDLEANLAKVGIRDDKKYENNKFYFCNTTIARFKSTPLSQVFRDKIKSMSDNLKLKPYTVDSVQLVTTNAVFENAKLYGNWQLR